MSDQTTSPHRVYTPSSTVTHEPLETADMTSAKEYAMHRVRAYPDSDLAIRPRYPRLSPLHSHSPIHDFSPNSPVGVPSKHYADAHHGYAPPVDSEVMLDEAAIEYRDDDYFDLTPADDSLSPYDVTTLSAETASPMAEKDFSRPFGMQTSSDRGSLDHYRPQRVASPLRNTATAYVFSHFVHITGPMLALSARRPKSPAISPLDASLPLLERGLWTNTMPIAALQHQGLLQAMLAISSLHIARLTGTSSTPSIKHYAYALKHIHHCVGNPSQRRTVPVIAASLLLGFYEIWTADHTKWTSHLAGACQLILERDLAAMYRDALALSKHDTRNVQGDPVLGYISNVDWATVTLLTGLQSQHANQNAVVGETQQSSNPPLRDIATFQTMQDLFWWYCKQDMIQSMISGNPLLLDFSQWVVCPPRAPINRIDAIYGTYDHILLILGRLADFIARDRTRKIAVAKAKADSMSRSGSEGTASRSSSSPGVENVSRPSMQLPSFFGMAPVSTKSWVPRVYQASQRSETIPTCPSDPATLDTMTRTAVADWTEIQAALTTFEAALTNSAFAPVPQNPSEPDTPFGPAVRYTIDQVAGLWCYFYLARIIACRCHPSMPPHITIAGAIAAPQSREYAMMIGRIASGMSTAPIERGLEAVRAAALCEFCLPLFFAGVQLQSPGQREWTIDSLFDMERLYGFGTAGVIAHGCQSSWIAAAMAGRGPAYVRRYNTVS